MLGGIPDLGAQGAGRLWEGCVVILGATWTGATVVLQTEKGFGCHRIWDTEAAWLAKISTADLWLCSESPCAAWLSLHF